MQSGKPIELLQCCSKHFHVHCLDAVSRQKCCCPLCRKTFLPAKPQAPEDTHQQQQLQDAKKNLLLFAKKSVMAILSELRGFELGTALEQKMLIPTETKNLLDEEPAVQKKRQ